MKFPRNVRISRGQFDVTAYASVFFLLILFLLLGSLVYTPGVRLSLPVADDLPGTEKPTVTVAIDKWGRFFFQNQMVVEESVLRDQLRNAAKSSREPLTLVVQADKGVAYANLVHLSLLARDAGIRDVLLATLPRIIVPPAKTSGQP